MTDYDASDYRPLGTLGLIVSALLFALGATGAIYTFLALLMELFPGASADLGDGAPLNLAFIAIGLVALLEIFARLILIVLFLFWINHAFKNLETLRVSNLEFSPGWAVGWWFIPFANLVIPFRVMRELWNATDPGLELEVAYAEPAPATSLIWLWWISFIGAGITGRVADVMVSDDGDPAAGFPVALMIGGALQAVAGISAAILVRRITARQEERRRRFEAAGAFSPPAPPTFGIPAEGG
jgi:hypothetical protein